MKIKLGHSPDSDDAFMFWGLATGVVKTNDEYEHILRDIQTLNEWAMEGRLESSAVSVHASSKIADRYALLKHCGEDECGDCSRSFRIVSRMMSCSAAVISPGRPVTARKRNSYSMSARASASWPLSKRRT